MLFVLIVSEVSDKDLIIFYLLVVCEGFIIIGRCESFFIVNIVEIFSVFFVYFLKVLIFCLYKII